MVGYQNKGFENSGYNISAATFVPVSGNKDGMTLNDLKPNGEFVFSAISFMTTGGATAKVMFQGEQVAATYIYWDAGDTEDNVGGWYLEDDENAMEAQNDVNIPFGTGFLVFRTVSETDAKLIYSGVVSTEPVTKSFPNASYTICGNCSPAAITLGDITPNKEFVFSSISFMTTGGATAKVDFNGEQVSASYVYWEDGEAEGGAGWYLEDDENATENQNGIELSAGQGFLVFRTNSETGATLTIPAAL